MSIISAFAILLFVLSPVLIPLTVSGVHAIAKWRRNSRTARKTSGPPSRAITPFVNGRSIVN
ncbi:MAG: hypothetical protein QOH60_1763 [Mycobacterium sp.]|nr:hypothetical protein [Mycobacterium sp.]